MDFDDLDEAQGRMYDILIYGATGFAGRCMAEHLDGLLSAPDAPTIRWAVAGRNAEKLRDIASRCSTEPAVYTAETPEELKDMAKECQVIIQAAGPYLLIGEAVIEACLEAGTHYLDLAGEVVWVGRMIEKYHEKAKEAGCVIVNCAGVMCSIDDMSFYLLAKKLGPLQRFQEYVFQSGGIAGGTSYSAVVEMDYMDNEDLEKYMSPYTFGGAPKDGVVRKEDEDALEVLEDEFCEKMFLFPQHQSHCASRVMRRTCMLFEENPDEEEPASALAGSAGLKILVADASTDKGHAERMCASSRRCTSMRETSKRRNAMEEALKRGQWPKPGQGPPKKTRELACGRHIAIGQDKDGEWAYVDVSTPDPGYDMTAMGIVHGALVLATESEIVKPAERGGVVTPAFAFHGTSWLEQLQASTFALLGGRKPTFEVKDGKPEPAMITEAMGAMAMVQYKLGEGFATGELLAFADP